MAKEKKVTFTKKMSTRDFINLVYFLETGDESDLDLSAYDPKALAVIEKRSARVTPAQKEQIDKFFENKPTGGSFKSFLDSLPKKTGVGNGSK